MADSDIALMAHLMRRAGFGATRDELEAYVAKGYEAKVEELLHPENAPPALGDEDIVRRYHIDAMCTVDPVSAEVYWLYRMRFTKRPFEEKLALFWHGVFATASTKLNSQRPIVKQTDLFRYYGLGRFRTLLIELSKDPAMIYFLDGKDNHKDAVNENFGRELLELFSMGVGNYTEDDVRECSRAFTGWTMGNASYHAVRALKMTTYPFGRIDWQFLFSEDDHDYDEKTFLGQTGAFNGEDIIDIICREPATSRFIARHLYNFFVADEPQVPAWQTVPPRDPEAVNALVDAFVKYDGDIRSVLRVLFNSDFFKNATFAKVKSPTELVVGTLRLAGEYQIPTVDDVSIARANTVMGQTLLDPPSVEGWHTGMEWIETGSLVNRVNFAAEQLEDVDKPGIKSIINRIRSRGDRLSPEGLVDGCLDLMGPLTVSEITRNELLDHAFAGGDIRFGPEDGDPASADRIKEMMQLIVGTLEYQLA